MPIALYVCCMSVTPSEQPHMRQGAVQHHGQHLTCKVLEEKPTSILICSREEGEPPIAKLTAPR